MNNKEYLIQILLKLRSEGIKNDYILMAIEKLPPHYYLSILEGQPNKKDIDINELIEIVKIVEIILKHNSKPENVLLYGFGNGWLLALLSNFCKRIYGVCNNECLKRKLENLFFLRNYKNIYLSKGENILCWQKVAPFDFIFSSEIDSLFFSQVTKYLTLKGLAIMPKLSFNNTIQMMKINKDNIILEENLKHDVLRKKDLI